MISDSDVTRPANSDKVLTVSLSPTFLLVFKSVLTLTIVTMVLCCSMVAFGITTDDGRALFQALATTWKMGFGAIIGLLGGKTF